MPQRNSRVVVIGATGHFGGRACRRLLSEPGLELYVSSRTEAAAKSFAAMLSTNGRSVQPVVLDQHSTTFANDLAALKPTVVIHTVGPFQGQNYGVAEACIASKSHYVDLADGRRFVSDFAARLDGDAKQAGVLLVTGASTLPGLSSAVVKETTEGWRELHEIEVSIAPAQQTPRGLCGIL